jgi:DNA-binding transcriptional MerR regulator
LTLEYIPRFKMSSMKKQAARSSLSSGDLAAMTGVSRDTLRYYERKGLLPSAERTQTGYRRYQPEALKRVQLIRGALGIGFTVEELREILKARDHGQAPCHRVYNMAIEKTQALESQIAELEGLHRALRSAIRSWSRKLNSTAAGKQAGLLEMFVANHPESARRISPMISPGLKRRLQRNEDKKK